jgi:Cu+-exporting ATPase
MTCSSCVAAIERRMKHVPGVVQAAVGLLAEQAEVEYDPNLVKPTAIIAAIREAGFTAEQVAAKLDNQVDLRIEGMSCASCVHAIEVRAAPHLLGHWWVEESGAGGGG